MPTLRHVADADNAFGVLQEVRELLNDWREEIDDSELIFLRCSKSYYRVFMGYDDAVLTRGKRSLSIADAPSSFAHSNNAVSWCR